MLFPSLTIGDKKAKLAIIQGGMAVRISMAPLAAAVANAGGIGVIAATGMSESELRLQLRLARTLLDTDCEGLIGVNIMRAIREFKSLLAVCIDEGVDIVFVGAGIIESWVYDMIEGTNTLVVPIVSRAGVLKVLVNREGIVPPAVVAESGEAGGHLGPKDPIGETGTTFAVTTEVIAAVEALSLDIPVIAAGGIRTGGDIRTLIELGASGVQIGIPYALTTEVREDSPGWQDILLAATDEVITGGKYGPGSPTGYPGRYARTPFIEKLIADGVVHFGDQRPTCQISCLTHCDYRDSRFQKSFCIFKHLTAAQQGDAENGLFFTGAGIAELNEVVTAKALTERLVAEFLAS